MREMGSGLGKTGRTVLFSLYFLVFILDKILFVAAVRTQPSFDFGLYGSVIVPTILFYFFIILTVGVGIRARSFGFLTPMSLLQFAPGMYGIALIQFMYAMGFSSPAGMILAFVSLIIAGWKAVAIPLECEIRKAKAD